MLVSIETAVEKIQAAEVYHFFFDRGAGVFNPFRYSGLPPLFERDLSWH